MKIIERIITIIMQVNLTRSSVTSNAFFISFCSRGSPIDLRFDCMEKIWENESCTLLDEGARNGLDLEAISLASITDLMLGIFSTVL